MCLHLLQSEEPSSLKSLPIKYVRREDLDTATRVKIAVIAKYFKSYGTITKLSERYEVSRTFIYTQVHLLHDMESHWFGENTVQRTYLSQLERIENLRKLFRYRLVGGCSLSKCSQLLKADVVKNTSYGWCQQQIHFAGSQLPNMVDWQGKVAYASDEIYYSGHQPILVTVEPVSGSILRIDRKPNLTKKGWESHWQALMEQGIQPTLLVRDEGVALKAAQKSVLQGVPVQPDTFHAITHQLYKIEQRLTRDVIRTIKEEYTAQQALKSAVSEQNILNKLIKLEQKEQKTLQLLEQLELFQWLYHHLRQQFKVVCSDGRLRNRTTAEQEAQAALELMLYLDIDLTNIVHKLKLLLPTLFRFLDQAKDVARQLQKSIPSYVLPFWMLYWQFKRSLMNIKDTNARKRLIKRFQWLEEVLKAYYTDSPKEYLIEKAIVFAQLDTIIKASSMVESVNARIRPFIHEMRGQISQEMLCLFMFFYNHRRFLRGKRKGKAPIEILTGKDLPKNKDWLDLLMLKVYPKYALVA